SFPEDQMAQATQSFSNHARYFPLFHFFALPVLLANAFMKTYQLVQSANRAEVWSALIAWAIAAGVFSARVMALRAQDRVIRLEETLRLQRLLPAEMHGVIPSLHPRQLVALRFASDDELPDLVSRTVTGEFAKPADIKRAVRKWRPDFLRA
ncbi:MAG: DUF6526 family protein, partial [Gemmatimonadaceae bacterium]